jgi:hypothetical protein
LHPPLDLLNGERSVSKKLKSAQYVFGDLAVALRVSSSLRIIVAGSLNRDTQIDCREVVLFRFTKIWEEFIVRIWEKWIECILISKERLEPRFA